MLLGCKKECRFEEREERRRRRDGMLLPLVSQRLGGGGCLPRGLARPEVLMAVAKEEIGEDNNLARCSSSDSNSSSAS